MILPIDIKMMQEALAEARIAKDEGEIPVGAVAVIGDKIIARAHNQREALRDPTAHAEVLVIRKCAEVLKNRRLSDVTLYVTLEPCAMCAGSVVASRIKRLVYGASDRLRGCAGSIYRLTEDPAMDWFCPSEGGVMRLECEELLSTFAFKEKSTM